MVSNVAQCHMLLGWCIKCQTDAQGWPLNSVRRGICRWTATLMSCSSTHPLTLLPEVSISWQLFEALIRTQGLLPITLCYYRIYCTFLICWPRYPKSPAKLSSNCAALLNPLLCNTVKLLQNVIWYDWEDKTVQQQQCSMRHVTTTCKANIDTAVYEGSNSTKTTRTSIRPLLKLTVQDVITQILPTWWKDWSISNLSDPQTNVETRKIAVLWYTEARKG